MAGLRYAWVQPAVRISLLLIAMINIAILGSIVIGVAELVTIRFGGDAWGCYAVLHDKPQVLS